MGKIIELNKNLANQIAAGEVAERPSSVLKELLENAIDAKAKNVEIQIKDAGLSYLCVTDDGEGMDEDDIKICTKRYATSKLSSIEDLENLYTFGFRGEALPSICAISLLKIYSQKENEQNGYEATFINGNLEKFTKAYLPKGTRIEVRDLFFNVPARLKFLPSKRIEEAHIENIIKTFAFIHNDVNFKLIKDNEIILDTNYHNEKLSRAILMLGEKHAPYIYEFDESSDHLSIKGALCAPMITNRDSRFIWVMVNGRLIKDKKIEVALKTSFRTLLEVGQYPIIAANVLLNPNEVDFNVHPRKAEIKFKDEAKVVGHIISLLRRFLSKTPWLNKDWQELAKKDEDSFSENYFQLSPLAFSLTSPVFQEKLLKNDCFKTLRILGQLKNTYLLFEGPLGLVLIDQHAAHERVMFEKIRKSLKDIKTLPLLIPLTCNFSKYELALAKEFSKKLLEFGILIEFLGEDLAVIREIPKFLNGADIEKAIKDLLHEYEKYKNSPSLDEIYDHLTATLACHSAIRAGQAMSKEEINALLENLDDLDIKAHCPHGRPIVKSIDSLEIKKWFHRT